MKALFFLVLLIFLSSCAVHNKSAQSKQPQFKLYEIVSYQDRYKDWSIGYFFNFTPKKKILISSDSIAKPGTKMIEIDPRFVVPEYKGEQ